MPIPTYTPGYPPDGSSLGQTKSTIRNNLDGTFQTLAVDHINNNGDPGSNPAGYHNVIHCVPQGSDPGAIAGYGELYSKSINSVVTDTALFWETGTGLITQLTVNLTPVAATDGYSFLPGGMIVQWGQSTSSSGNQTITFPLAFPNACFNVQVTLTVPSSTANSSAAVTYPGSAGPTLFSKTQFNFRYGGSSINGFFWFAIGN
jgi:hypothetical protein